MKWASVTSSGEYSSTWNTSFPMASRYVAGRTGR